MTKNRFKDEGGGVPAASASTPCATATSGTAIVACGRHVDVEAPVVLWDAPGGFACPHRRGRKDCSQHDPILNDGPTRPDADYQIRDMDLAYTELTKCVHQFVLHYDVSFTSAHCHELICDSTFKGSHFYLDLDGTIYQTCDLYWKTNTAPGDDRAGNDRAVHVEMANLSWQALAADSDLYQFSRDQYKNENGRWRLELPERWRGSLRTPGFKAYAARSYGSRGYFSRTINGRVVRMWDFTEEQYRSLIRLCLGVHRLLPRVGLKVPFDARKRRTPLSKLRNFATFKGVLGHAHVQGGATEGIKRKYDPGSAFDWGRLRREFARYKNSKFKS